MADIVMIKFGFIETMAFAAILYWVGVTLCRRLSFLSRYNIPPAVAGGLLFAALKLALSGRIDFQFDLTLMDPFMLAFFATIGLGASAEMLREGGGLTVRLLIAAVLLLLLQNAGALLIGKAAGLAPMLSILAGSTTMTGGHGTGLVFADEIRRLYNIESAQAVAIACATFGVIAGSLVGGPIAERLIRRNSLATAAAPGEYRSGLVADVFSFGDRGEEITNHAILMTIFQITFAVSVGMWGSARLLANGFHVPAYAVALVTAIVIRNAGDHVSFFRVHPRIVKHISGACLSFFLAFALMSVDLAELKPLAGPLALIMLFQLILTVLFVWYATYELAGGGYDGAVIAAGHAGFGLGATPNAIANMEAVCARYGPAPEAFFAVTAVGAFFIDIMNVLVINILIRCFG